MSGTVDLQTYCKCGDRPILLCSVWQKAPCVVSPLRNYNHTWKPLYTSLWLTDLYERTLTRDQCCLRMFEEMSLSSCPFRINISSICSLETVLAGGVRWHRRTVMYFCDNLCYLAYAGDSSMRWELGLPQCCSSDCPCTERWPLSSMVMSVVSLLTDQGTAKKSRGWVSPVYLWMCSNDSFIRAVKLFIVQMLTKFCMHSFCMDKVSFLGKWCCWNSFFLSGFWKGFLSIYWIIYMSLMSVYGHWWFSFGFQ